MDNIIEYDYDEMNTTAIEEEKQVIEEPKETKQESEGVTKVEEKQENTEEGGEGIGMCCLIDEVTEQGVVEEVVEEQDYYKTTEDIVRIYEGAKKDLKRKHQETLQEKESLKELFESTRALLYESEEKKRKVEEAMDELTKKVTRATGEIELLKQKVTLQETLLSEQKKEMEKQIVQKPTSTSKPLQVKPPIPQPSQSSQSFKNTKGAGGMIKKANNTSSSSSSSSSTTITMPPNKSNNIPVLKIASNPQSKPFPGL